MLTDPTKGKGNEKNPTPHQLGDVTRCLPTFISAYCDSASAIETLQASYGKGRKEGVLGNKHHGELESGYIRNRMGHFNQITNYPISCFSSNMLQYCNLLRFVPQSKYNRSK